MDDGRRGKCVFLPHGQRYPQYMDMVEMFCNEEGIKAARETGRRKLYILLYTITHFSNIQRTVKVTKVQMKEE